MEIKLNRQVEAPASALWNYIGDYSNIHRFHPLLKGSDFIEGADSCEIGATRQCDMKDGNYIKERITDWKEGSHYTVDIYETSMPLRSAKATIGVRSNGENTSEVYMEMSMEPKYKIMQPMMFLFFKYVAGPGILKGLENIYKKEHAISVA
jgi:ribosome-associated toxin RatA of RatAB toxin-antitoxin module